MDENYYIWRDFIRWWKFVTAPFWGHRDKKKYRIHPRRVHYYADHFPKRLPYLGNRQFASSRK